MWSDKYIGIPYRENGRDFDGIDCWGLARLVYKEELGIELPSFAEEYDVGDTREYLQELIAQHKEGWEPVDSPSKGTMVLFKILGNESHVGVAVNETHFVHARDGYSSSLEAFNSAGWKSRIVGYYKYSESSSVVLNAVPNPLKTLRYTVPIPPGTKLTDLVAWIEKEWAIPEEITTTGHIFVNGRKIAEEDWNTTILQEADSVEYRALPRGGVVKAVVAIAIAVFAPQIALAIGQSFFGVAAGVTATAFASTVGGALLTAGVIVGGNMLLNAIAPVRPPIMGGVQDVTNPGVAERQLMVSGTSNRANLYGSIPLVLGKVRMTPPIAANTYTDFWAGTDQSNIRLLLAWGYRPLIINSDSIRIGTTPLSEFQNYGYSADVGGHQIYSAVTGWGGAPKYSTTSNSVLETYGPTTKDIEQVQKNVTLICPGNPTFDQVTPGPWIEATSSGPCSAVKIIFHFPQGMRRIRTKGDGAGNSSGVSVRIQYQYRFLNSSTWSDVYEDSFGAGEGRHYKDAYSDYRTMQVPPYNDSPVVVRARRVSGDNTEDVVDFQYYHTAVFLAATFTGVNRVLPIETEQLVALSSISIRASDQIANGLEGINALVMSSGLDFAGNTIVYRAINNPASLFLHVLIHKANAEAITFSDLNDLATKVDLVKLQQWHNYCASKGFTYNSVIGAARSVLDVLKDICAAGRASPAIVDGRWTVLVDEPKPVVQHFTPHNSWGFESSKTLSKIPDGLRVNYYDEAQDYQEAEIIVYNVGKDYSNAKTFEAIELPGVTTKSAVIDHAKWHMAQAKLRPEVYSLNTDIEYLVCNRGDRVKVMHDVPMWGLGSGRIKNVLSNGNVLELDEDVPITTNANYTIRVRLDNGDSYETTIKKTFFISSIRRSNNTVTIIGANLPFQRGDIVTVSGSILGTLDNVTVDSGSPEFITLKVPGANFDSIADSGTINIVSTRYGRVTVDSPNILVKAQDLFLYGTLQNEAQDLVIISVEPSSNMTAKLTLVDYGVTPTYNIFNDYLTLTANTVFETQITEPPALLRQTFRTGQIPSVQIARSNSAVSVEISPGTFSYRLHIVYINLVSALPDGVNTVECQYDLASSTTSIGIRTVSVPYQSENIYIDGVSAGETYRYRLRYVTSNLSTGTWSEWRTHTIQGNKVNNTEVSTLVVKRIGRYLNITPTISNRPADFKYYEIRVFKDEGAGDFWDNTSTQIVRLNTTGTVNVDLKLFAPPRLSVQGVKYRIAARAVNSVGVYSSTSAIDSVTVYAIS
jgi:hypothetical protein